MQAEVAVAGASLRRFLDVPFLDVPGLVHGEALDLRLLAAQDHALRGVEALPVPGDPDLLGHPEPPLHHQDLLQQGDHDGVALGAHGRRRIDPGVHGPAVHLNAHTGQILSEDPEGYEGVPEPPDWDDYEFWLYLDAIWPAQGWQDMADFIATVEDPAVAERLNDAIRGKGAFRRFKNITYDTEHESRFVLFSDEREAGRARHWLAERGLRPD